MVKNSAGFDTVTVCELDAAPKASPPAVGRTIVCTTSLAWSTSGILSATNSIASRTTRIASTQPLVSQCHGPRQRDQVGVPTQQADDE